MRSLRAEAAAAKGLCAGIGVLDLAKAFEMVRLEEIWASGLELGFPPIVLRLVMETFA